MAVALGEPLAEGLADALGAALSVGVAVEPLALADGGAVAEEPGVRQSEGWELPSCRLLTICRASSRLLAGIVCASCCLEKSGSEDT